MRFDVDLHRYTIKLPNRLAGNKTLEMSVVDTGARDAAQTMDDRFAVRSCPCILL